MPRERIVPCPRSENFWQAGPTGPCGPCSELYLDRGLEWGKPDDLPGGDNERFLEYWNLVFMQYDQDPVGTLTPLPKQNIDTGLGLNRMALIQQGTDSIFETDQFLPLIRLGEELSGRSYDSGDFDTDRALRILADHTRGMSFLVADGVVPSNEDRGYVLRRVMRRALLQGRRIGIEDAFLTRFSAVVRELMGAAYPELHAEAETVDMWLAREEQQFGQTLEQGTRILDEHIARARDEGREGIGAEQAFQLHDTYGFPFELTVELAGGAGPRRRRGGLRGPDGRAAHAGAGQRGPRRPRRRSRARPRLRRRGGRAHRVHGLRAARAGDGGRRGRRGGRPGPGQARRVALLRHRRRPDRRRRRRRVRVRRLPRAGRRRRPARATTRRSCSSPSRASCTRASA